MIHSCIMPKHLVDTEDLYDVAEAARLIGMGYATLYRWIKRGDIVPLRVSGRTLITKSEVDRVRKVRGASKK